MDTMIENLKFATAPSLICDWVDRVAVIIDSAQSTLKIYWREGFWCGNLFSNNFDAIIRAHKRGVIIEVVAGPVWLSTLESETHNNGRSFFWLVKSGIVHLYYLKESEQRCRFIVVDEASSYVFPHSTEPEDIAIQSHETIHSGDSKLLNSLFRVKVSSLQQCMNPKKDLLVLEPFEYVHIRQLGTLNASHQEIHNQLQQLEERKRKIAHGIVKEIRERQPAT
jgi:hypothetical protein